MDFKTVISAGAAVVGGILLIVAATTLATDNFALGIPSLSVGVVFSVGGVIGLIMAARK